MHLQNHLDLRFRGHIDCITVRLKVNVTEDKDCPVAILELVA